MPDTNSASSPGNVWTTYGNRDRTLLIIGSVASFWIFSTVAALFSFPQFSGHDASLLAQPSAILILVMTAIVLVACVLITSFFAGIAHFEGGLFCAAVGLGALSTRGGSIRYTLMDSPGSGVFLRLLIELVLLFAFVGVGWLTLHVLRDMRLLRAEPHGDDDLDAMPGQGALALGAQIILMIVLMLLFAQTDEKSQVIGSVALSAFLAALGAHSLFPARPSLWFWVTPLIVGAVGYVFAWSSGNTLPGGAVGGLMPALARPLPLDYASAGVAGSIFGYWTSRRWQYERDYDPESPDQVEDALEHPAGDA